MEHRQVATVTEVNDLIHFNSTIDLLRREPWDESKISDGYHTFEELYNYRKMYNAGFLNLLPYAFSHIVRDGRVYKSKKHSDGEPCFGGGWFIVVFIDDQDKQITNHYRLEDWDLFDIPAVDTPIHAYDGHTPADCVISMMAWLKRTFSESAYSKPLING